MYNTHRFHCVGADSLLTLRLVRDAFKDRTLLGVLMPMLMPIVFI
jgi:hypothetical protein